MGATLLDREYAHSQLSSSHFPEPEPELPAEKTEPEAWQRRLDALLLISEEAQDSAFSTQIFHKIADTVLGITRFDSLSVKLYDERAERFSLVAQRGLPEAMAAGTAVRPLRASYSLYSVARTLQPLYTPDHRTATGPRNEWIDRAGFRTSIFVPMLVQHRFVGIYALAAREPIQLDRSDILWLSSIGRQLGIIVHRARFAEQLKISATLEERTRLGREMHDGPSQVLGYLNMKLQTTQRLVAAGETAQAISELHHLEEVSARAYEQVRDVIFDLRVSPFLDQNLMTTFERYVHEYGERSGLEIIVDRQGWNDPVLPPEVQLQVMCVLQEALANVRKHADARHVWVTARSNETEACIYLKDDGRGFEVEATRRQVDQRCWGLQTMGERAEIIGGVLRIRSVVGRGTEVEICLPVAH